MAPPLIQILRQPSLQPERTIPIRHPYAGGQIALNHLEEAAVVQVPGIPQNTTTNTCLHT